MANRHVLVTQCLLANVAGSLSSVVQRLSVPLEAIDVSCSTWNNLDAARTKG